MSERPWYESHFDGEYLEAYAHRDEEEAEAATSALLAPLGLDGRTALDLGCGAGRYAAALQRRGATVVGLDLSAALLGAARRRGVRLLVRGDMRALPFAGSAFDLVASMFTSFGYFAEAAEDRRVLAEVARVLRPGGAFVLDTFNVVVLRRTVVPRSERRVADLVVVEERRIDGDCIVKTITQSRGGERRRTEERVRLWGDADIESALAEVGLTVVARNGDYAGAPYDARTSPRRIVRAQRGS